MWCSCKQMRQPIQFYDRFIHHLWIIIHLLYIGSEGKRKDTPSKCKRMAQPCAISVFLNLLLLITSFIGSNKSILNDVLSSIKDSPSWDHQTAPTQSRMRHETLTVNDSFTNTITDETRDSHDTFDTKFWDSIKLMNPCVFDVCQYLRVLILSCLSCSMVVIMIITSTQTDRQSIYGVCHEYLNGAIHGLWGMSAHHERHIRPHGNFMLSDVPVCLPSSCLSSIMNQSSMKDESSLIHLLSFPLDCHIGIAALSY